MNGASKFITCTVLALSLGLHWALLQSMAWTGMLVQFASETGIVEALQKTFDGKHPCSICKFVQATDQDRSQHDEAPVWLPKSKIDPIALQQIGLLCLGPKVEPLKGRPTPCPKEITWEPQKPPPRVLS